MQSLFGQCPFEPGDNFGGASLIEGCEKKLQNLVCNHIDVKLIHAKTRGLKNDSRNNFSVDNK